MDSISKKIKTILIDKNMKQKDICDYMNMNKGNFSTLLKKDTYNTTQLQQIAEALGCEVEVIFTDKDTKERY